MSAKNTAIEPEAERITLDQLKDRAEDIRDLAVSEVDRVTTDLLEVNATRTLLVAAGVVLVAASVAYYLGTRAARRRADIL